MRPGPKVMEALRAEVTGILRPGDDLVAAGAVALRGTALLAQKEYERLRTVFSAGFLADACAAEKKYGAGQESAAGQAWQMAMDAGAVSLYAMGSGGVLAALWKMAEVSSVGLAADLRKIPIRQETIEICEFFGLNPYKLSSGGSILIGIPGGYSLVREYRRMGLPAAVVGQAKEGNDRLLCSGENVRYLERPGRDELEKIIADGEA